MPCAGRLAKAMFLKFSTSLLAILAATVCNLESRVAKRVPEDEKRMVTRATITKRAIKISIRENPRLAFSPSTLLRVNLRIAYRLGIKYIVAGASLIARVFADPTSKGSGSKTYSRVAPLTGCCNRISVLQCQQRILLRFF